MATARVGLSDGMPPASLLSPTSKFTLKALSGKLVTKTRMHRAGPFIIEEIGQNLVKKALSALTQPHYESIQNALAVETFAIEMIDVIWRLSTELHTLGAWLFSAYYRKPPHN